MGFKVCDPISETNRPHEQKRASAPPPLRLRRRGFSLPELMVVAGIIVVLTALLLPSICMLREKAVDVVCTGRLHQLVIASQHYASMNDGWFPAAASEGQPAAVPDMLPARLLNDLRRYIGYPAIGPETAHGNLPSTMQCPRVERLDGTRGPFVMKGSGLVVIGYYTGYAYVGGLARSTTPGKSGAVLPRPYPVGPQPKSVPGVPGGMAPVRIPGPPLPTTATVLRPGRAAAKMGDLGTLWADDVSLSSAGGGFWRFAHPRPGAAGGPQALTYAEPRGCQGQHRASADGRVDWVAAEDLGLPAGEQVMSAGVTKAASPLDAGASYRADSGYWWF
jgi:prepilin-type N-terminal cleavage/methylation domain-containing protein